MPRVIITAPNKTPQPYRFQLDRQVVLIGRGSENDIAVDCSSMSVRHAEMLRVEGGYKLRDHGSTNGIKLDGKRCEEIVLRDGLSVKLGDVVFDFELSEEERELLAREKMLDDTPVFNEEPKPVAEGEQAEPKKKTAGSASGGGRGFMIFVGLVLFALLAFFGGLSLRHYMQTGGSLLGAIQSKTKTLKANRSAQAPLAPAPESPAPTTPVVAPSPAPGESAPPAPPASAEPAPGQ